jgi:hypothetical protein
MAFKLDHLAIDNSEVREIVKELNRYGKTDVLKALRAFNREIAKEVSDKARSLGAKQPVPKASQSTKNIKPQATRTQAKIKIGKPSNRQPSALSMEFGRDSLLVPVRGRSKPRKILREEVGRLPFSRRGATFPYRRWIGNQYATGTSSFGRFGKGGYVVMRTIAREQDRIMSTYNDRLYEALAKAIGKKI